MGVRLPLVVSNTIANVTLVTNAETVVAITPPFSPPLDSAIVILIGWCSISTGAGTVQLNLMFRRGTTVAGVALDQPAGQDIVAGHTGGTALAYFDVQQGIAGQQWCLTCGQFSATANGTCRDAFIAAFAL